MQTDAARTRLTAAGLRVTAPRVAVLESIQLGQHLRVDEIARLVRERIGKVSTQAVYNVLGALADAGLVRRIEPAGSPAQYEIRAGDNHHHLVCRGCGVVVDVDRATGEAACLEPPSAAGFAIDSAEVVFWGRCPDCQRA